MPSPVPIARPHREAQDFFSLEPTQFEAAIREFGLPPYRARQVLTWVYHRFVADFDEMTDLSLADRAALATAFRLSPPAVGRVNRSADGRTVKLLLVLEDGQVVEGVVMLHPRRRPTLCVSVQVGCAQGCLFCATGALGLRRQMTAAEIVGQIWRLRLTLARDLADERVPTVVFMGMGEPLDNETHFLHALRVLQSEAGFGLASRKITVSTIGGPERIRALARLGLQINLAVSLHASTDALRGKLVPGQRGVAVAELIAAARDWFDETGREVTLEHVLIGGINDSEEEACRLAGMLAGFPGKVNLIAFNPVSHNRMQPPLPGTVQRFCDVLAARGIKVTVRHSQGRDIAAACGQLAAAGGPPGTVIRRCA